MNTFKNLSLSVVLSASLLACATSNDPNQANFWSKQGQMACAVGGIIGGAIGLLLSDDDPTLGLALGASVGCGAGAGSNYLLDRERIKYKNKEELLAAETLRLKKLNSISRKINRETETTIAKDQAKIRRLREDIRSKRISESQARKELQKIDENINEMRGLVSSMENEKRASQNTINQARAAKLNTSKAQAEVAQLDAKIRKQKELLSIAMRNRSAIKVRG